ncbi:UDP-3-O-acyl-N-acetylglucosamine deacetylase [Desulfosarcina ovata subsp. sediminis]|uniref:UDP-3-O-acyl-N-acetylglucosamine deacetylase n=1 Tax=Desulfosarcina ovata subsp. sediminis TaxID=885957 RepID=A0A5K7ZY25_9BACT|nr:UDP-3-O-acyl-N-acetylglucosamine deacetylase [Desulfosarcina ovata]BBO85162.1 UDP-3-O-acyl-N-acetylglucosamine deacetylase [Desulfosarcina ovata subsp. sediminis]
MVNHQHTLAKPVTSTGIGVHSGNIVNLTLLPAPANHGIRFVRTDLPGRPGVTAHFNNVVDTSLATVIGAEGCIVSTVEHLMAGFSGMSIDNAIVEVDAYELPIMDGSAGPFTELIQSAGILRQEEGSKCYFKVNTPITLAENGKSVTVYPADQFRITCTIVYNHPLIGTQTCDFVVTPEIFRKEICTARTFGFLHEVEMMKRYGLGRGGSLENALVIDTDRVLNEGGLRFADEFVRHKALDLIGDFSLIGMPIMGHVVTHCSGHAFNHAFLEKFFSQKESWETCTLVSDALQANGS